MFTKARTVLRSTDIIIAVVAIVAVVLAGCTTEDADTTSTTTTTSTEAASVDDDIVFGSGVLPSTVPADLPIPEQAVIGSTLVDTPRGLTEVIVTYPADVTAVVDFFTTNLPTFDYVVDSSTGTDGKWELEFSKGDLSGVIIVSTAGSGLSAGALTIVVPVTG